MVDVDSIVLMVVEFPVSFLIRKNIQDEVFRRDNYECEYCGENAENAHHIKPKKLEPFFALDPDYGIACCKKCHNKYGHKDECAAYILSSVVCGSGG